MTVSRIADFVPVFIVIVVGIFHVIWTLFCDFVQRVRTIDYHLLCDDLGILIGTGALTYVLCEIGLSNVAWTCLIPLTIASSATLFYHTYRELRDDKHDDEDDTI